MRVPLTDRIAARARRLLTPVRRAALVALVALGASGCDDPFSPWWDRGNYPLTAVNGRALPVSVFSSLAPGSSATRVEVVSGTLELRRDRSWRMLLQVRETGPLGQMELTRAYGGRYESEGRALWLYYSDPGTFYESVLNASWRGSWVEVVVPGVVPGGGVLCWFDR